MKKILKEFAVLLPVIVLALGLYSVVPASAQGVFPISGGLCGSEAFPCPKGNTLIEMVKSMIARVADNVRYIIGAVAILMIVVAGVKLIVAQGEEEVFNKQKDTILYAIIGLAIIGLAGDLSALLDVDKGGFLKDSNVMVQRAKLFSRTSEILITLIKYLVGGIATFFVIRNGLRLVLLGGNEEEVGKDKKNIMWSAFGLLLILIANPIVNKVFFKIDMNQYPGVKEVSPAIDKARLIQEVAGMTNLVAAITGPFALLALMAGSLMYVMGGADEEKTGHAKKIIIGALIGLFLIYGAFAIVSTFVAREFEGL